MPKRPRSYEDDISRQCKMHISEKEVIGGVLTQVYNKTTNRLFKGVNMWYKSLADAKKPTVVNRVLSSSNRIDDVLCVGGHYASISDVNKCDYCDKSVCLSCLRECKTCQHIYCTNCSVEEYSNSGESWLCLSCV